MFIQGLLIREPYENSLGFEDNVLHVAHNPDLEFRARIYYQIEFDLRSLIRGLHTGVMVLGGRK